MSATIGAALKKIAVALLSNKETLKKVSFIILLIIVVILMPIIAALSMSNGTLEFDVDELQQKVVANLTIEEKMKLLEVNETSKSIERDMLSAGFSLDKVREAQVLYLLALSDKANESDFISVLIGCFSKEQTDEELIVNINSAFGTEISPEDFSKVMQGIRSATIDTSSMTNLKSKNSVDLVEWAKQAEAHQWGYVYGTYGMILNETVINNKIKQYPNEVGKYENFIRENYIGIRTVDCVGLIKSYAWYDTDNQSIEIGTNGMSDISANEMFNSASETGPINTIPETPGLAVWQDGHIGIYIGGGKVIEAAGTEQGVIQTDLSNGKWTHWLKVPNIEY